MDNIFRNSSSGSSKDEIVSQENAKSLFVEKINSPAPVFTDFSTTQSASVNDQRSSEQEKQSGQRSEKSLSRDQQIVFIFIFFKEFFFVLVF